MKTIRTALIGAIATCVFAACSTVADKPAAAPAAQRHAAPAAASALARRLLGARADEFEFVQVAPRDTKRRTFTIEAGTAGRIRITGDDAITLASGLNTYLKDVAHAHVSWSYDQLRLPMLLPRPAAPIVRTTWERHASAFNYTTFNYTMAWWDWSRWEREIDLLALQGIDAPLTILGTEATWLNVLARFGYTRDEGRRFLVGPAYTAWWLMGNISGVGGPLSDASIAGQVALQKKILARARELGMRPVLQGFVGIVPPDLAQKRPGTRLLDQGGWVGMPRPPVLAPDDPLFEPMARAWYEESEKLYGRIDDFAGDLFHEGGRTHGIDVTAMAAKVQALMRAHNPRANWTLQGWSGNPKASLLKGLDPTHTTVVELCNEYFRNWENTQGFSGMPWQFGTISSTVAITR